MTKPAHLKTVIAINVLVIFACLMVAEFGLSTLISRAEPTGNAGLDKLAQKIYWSRVSVIQHEADCAQYDVALTYTLRPGTCSFDNAGFATRVDVNSVGLRDDEASLIAPEIVVLGDSHAMGWGVDRDDTFAQLIEEATGKSTLNAGISSYGTPREIIMLQRLDLSALQTLIVQYSDNDNLEIRAYLEGGRNLKIQSAENYATSVANNRPSRYFPGAYLLSAAKAVAKRLTPVKAAHSKRPSMTAGLSNADKFLRVLADAELGGARVNLVLLEINTHGRGDGGFIDALRRSPEMGDVKAVFETVNMITTQDFLGPLDRLYPDGHMNAAGHRKVSEALLAAMPAIKDELPGMIEETAQ